MRLQWSEIRARAAAFSERHKQARYEKGETQTFYNDFFDCFGVSRRQVATYEQRVRNLPGDKQGFIDLYWPGTLIVEQKSAGLDLKKASNQALDYYDWLPEKDRPRYILTCDFQRWHLLDLEEGREWRFLLGDLKNHVEAFAFILGVQPRLNRRQSPANVKASQLWGGCIRRSPTPVTEATISKCCWSACYSSCSRTTRTSSTTRISSSI